MKASVCSIAVRQRERIESAINRVQAVSDEAHFYAGVAFGAALTDFS